jgi:general secretion pathway protein I
MAAIAVKHARAAVPRQRDCGFTLFEVMVALAVLALAAMACLQAFAMTVRLASRGETELALLLCAQEVLEQTRMSPALPEDGAGDMQQGPFTLHWERHVAATEAPGLYQVRVKASSGEREDDALELETYLVK